MHYSYGIRECFCCLSVRRNFPLNQLLDQRIMMLQENVSVGSYSLLYPINR